MSLQNQEKHAMNDQELTELANRCEQASHVAFQKAQDYDFAKPQQRDKTREWLGYQADLLMAARAARCMRSTR